MLGLLLFAALSGCADYTMVGIEKRQAEILVHPTHIDFGHLESGFESESKYFTVTNTGDEDLIISSPVLVSDEDRFRILGDDDEDIIIPAGEMIQVDVRYVPETFETNEGYIEIVTNDEDEGSVQVTLEGYGDAPVITVSPEDFDYGDISIGCDNEERITITNDGNLPLLVDSISQMVTQPQDIIMEFGSLPDPPWVIDPGLSLDFLVSYVPTDVGSDDSSIRIDSNDPIKPSVEVLQHGDGDIEQWYTETHIQEEIPVLDILWVVDDSGSMNRFQTNLSSNIGLFVSSFMATGADYHIGVITTSDHFVGSLITSADPDPASALALEVMVGIYGAGNERGIDMSIDALSTSASAGPGSAFFREEATLVVIYVSDEPDHSMSTYAQWLAFFDSVKPAGQFIPYGVIGDYPSGCSIGSQIAQFGDGYYQLINNYGGDWYSICSSDWGVQLQNLADALLARRFYELAEDDPIEETIEVRVNGQVSEDWRYDETTNTVEFAEDSVPEEGQTIEISYAVWGCDGE